MNIQFFGHSIFSSSYRHGRSNNQPKTLVEIINDRYGVEGRYIAVPSISQERILMDIKKYKEHMDFAIISHADPMNVFFPSWDHDFADAKIPDENIRYWSENEDDPHMFLFTKGKFFTERTMDRSKYPRMHWLEVHKYMQEYKSIHYNPDLQKNRAAGALLQTVGYLKAKQIRTIHLIRKEFIPSWYEFDHGIVDHELLEFQYKPPYGVSYSKSINAINSEGNVVAANKLINYIENYEKYAIEHQNNNV